jgi:hypothetical protein
MDIDLKAGPLPPQPPLVIAVIVVAIGVVAPFIYVRDGTPSLLLGIAALVVPIAGAVMLIDAIRARHRAARDRSVRTRARIDASGITLLNSADNPQFFSWSDVKTTYLGPHILSVRLQDGSRHAVRFGKLATDPARIREALVVTRR